MHESLVASSFMLLDNWWIYMYRWQTIVELSQTLERKESDLQSLSEEKRSDLQAEVLDMEKKLFRGNESKSNSNDSDHSVTNLMEELNTAKNVRFNFWSCVSDDSVVVGILWAYKYDGLCLRQFIYLWCVY